MQRCLVKKNVRVGQVDNIGSGSEHRPIVANNKHKLVKKCEREYKDIVKEQRLQFDVMCWFQDYSQISSESFISCLAARKSLIVDGFYLDKSVLFLVNVPILLRNLLRMAISCFVPRISSIYIKLETLWRIWQWFLYWKHMSIIYFYVCISSSQGQTLHKAAKDFSLVVQDFKINGRLKRWRNVVYRAISSILRLISPYLFPFGKHLFICSMAC